MGIIYSIYINTTSVPWHIFDWLEKDIGVFYLTDFNWQWEDTNKMRIDLFDEELAMMVVLKWT